MKRALLLFAALTAAACGDSDEGTAEREEAPVADGAHAGSPAESVVPPPVPGAVLSVAGVPILASDLEALTEATALATPEFTRAHHQRLALELLLIPRAALAVEFAEPRASAQQTVQADAKRLREAASLPAEERRAIHSELGVEVEAADVRQLGPEIWAALLEAPRGAWLGPFEDLGRWRCIRWLAQSPTPDPATTEFTVERLDRWFLPDETTHVWIERALAEATLEVHDASVGELVTERLRWRMKR